MRFPTFFKSPPEFSGRDTGLEHVTGFNGNQKISKTGAVKGAAIDGNSFAEAVAAVMRLPLSDADKAEAVRRLLARTENHQ